MTDYQTKAVCLADLLADPSLLDPPSHVVPNFVYDQRVTILAGEGKKAGKSTLTAAMIAAVTKGTYFLTDNCKPGKVLLFWLEEHPRELLHNIMAFGGDLTQVHCVKMLEDPRNFLLQIEQEIDYHRPQFVGIDSLAKLSAAVVMDPWKSTEWNFLYTLVDMARVYDLGMLILHHARRSDG